MEIDPTYLVPVAAQMGERCWGALMLKGDAWPRDVPVWLCEHRHEGPSAAEACAQAELDRRVTAASRALAEDASS
jgi:hypothetical protein